MSLTSYRAAPPRVKSSACSDRSIGMSLAFGRSGSDLLSRALRHSTIGAESFHVRVRNGIGCTPLARATGSSERKGMRSKSVHKAVERMSTAARNE